MAMHVCQALRLCDQLHRATGPHLATSDRAFLSHVSKSFPRLPLFGLVDWNPDGLAILSL